MASIESQIFTSLKTILESLSWAKYVEYEKIRPRLTEFHSHELPAIQFYDATQSLVQLQGRSDVTWVIVVEIVMKRSSSDPVDQALLLDRMDEIHKKIGENPQLGLTSLPASEGSMKSILPLTYATDLHMEDPFYTANMSFQVTYLKPYSDLC